MPMISKNMEVWEFKFEREIHDFQFLPSGAQNGSHARKSLSINGSTLKQFIFSSKFVNLKSCFKQKIYPKIVRFHDEIKKLIQNY